MCCLDLAGLTSFLPSTIQSRLALICYPALPSTLAFTPKISDSEQEAAELHAAPVRARRGLRPHSRPPRVSVGVRRLGDAVRIVGRLLQLILMAGWILPLILAVKFLLDWRALVAKAGSEEAAAAANSFPFVAEAQRMALIAAVWLLVAVVWWGFRVLRQRSTGKVQGAAL